MNALLLLIIALCVFVMGYRFYAKFLALGVFGIDHDAPTPASHRSDQRDYIHCNRWVLLSQHTGASVGIVSVLGVAVGVIWGWVPAFLWIVVGTLVAGGTYALASLWASLRKSGDSMAGVVFDLTGVWGALPMYALGIIVLLSLCALTSVLLGQLLHAHPEATWSFLGLLVVPLLVRRGLYAQSPATAFVWTSTAISFFMITVLVGQWYPLGLSGVWKLSIGGSDVLSLPHEMIWAAVGLTLAYHSVKAPVSEIARPRGNLVGALLIVLMLLMVAGLSLTFPQITAPDFNRSTELPGLFPLLFLVVTGGAISGVYALIVAGPTVRQVERQKDAPLVAYGGVMIDGVLAVLVVVVLCAGFTTADDWLFLYGVWPDQPTLYVWLDLAITKMARFVAAAGIPLPWAVGAVAAVLAAMALTMLENSLRALAYAVEEFVEDFDLKQFRGPNIRGQIAAGLAGVATLWLLQADLGLDHWLLFGMANQMLAGTFLLVLGLILLRLSRNSFFVMLPGLFLLICALWGAGWILVHGWQNQEWTLLVMTCLVTTLALLSWIACSAAFLTIRRQRETSIPVPPGF